MTFVAIPLTIKIVVTYSINLNEAINVFYSKMQDGEPPEEADVQAAADAYYSALFDEWKPLAWSGNRVVDIVATDMSVEFGIERTTTGTLPILGAGVSEPLPAAIAAVVSHRSGKVGRSERGRTYVPGFTEADSDGNTMSTTVVTGLFDLFIAIDDAMAAAGMRRTIISFIFEGIKRTVPKKIIPIVEIINDVWDIQRRRMS